MSNISSKCKKKTTSEQKLAFAYYRYSSHNQDDGNSIQAQRAAVKAFAKQHNIKIVGEYIDKAKSGTNTNRESYQAMLSDLDINPDVKFVLIHFLDRIHRSTKETLDMIYDFNSKNVRLLTTNGLDSMNKDHWANLLDEACQAEKYSLKLSQETRKGMKVNASNAVHNGGKVPYGFTLSSDHHLIADKTKATAIKKIFEMYAAGLSYSKIIEWLDTNGYKSINGKSFCESSIKAILENEKYAGIYTWDKTAGKDYRGKRNSYKKKDTYTRIEGGCEAIVSQEIFDKVQERLNDSANRIKNHNGKNYYPMNGKIFCNKCKNLFKGHVQYSSTNKDNKPTKQYKTQCTCYNKKSINQQYIDDMIIYALRECIFSDINTDVLIDRLNKMVEAETDDIDIQIDLLTVKKDELKQIQSNLIKSIEQGFISEAIKIRLNETEQQINDIDLQLNKLALSKPNFTEKELQAIKREFVPYVRDVCNEDTVNVINDTIKEISISDTIEVFFKDGIRINRDTKKAFNK